MNLNSYEFKYEFKYVNMNSQMNPFLDVFPMNSYMN